MSIVAHPANGSQPNPSPQATALPNFLDPPPSFWNKHKVKIIVSCAVIGGLAVAIFGFPAVFLGASFTATHGIVLLAHLTTVTKILTIVGGVAATGVFPCLVSRFGVNKDPEIANMSVNSHFFLEREVRRIEDPEEIQKRLKREKEKAAEIGEKEIDKALWNGASNESKYDISSTKVSLKHGQDSIRVHTAAAKGPRPEMQDEHLFTTFKITIGKKTYPVTICGVFDGHGGKQASRYLKEYMASAIQERLQAIPEPSDLQIFNALKLAFVKLDIDFFRTGQESGSMATVAMLLDGNLWIANTGDSRAVLVQDGKSIQLSEDAKPNMDPENRFVKSVIKREGFIYLDRNKVLRVKGGLSATRAIGDHQKRFEGRHGNKCITPRPKITKTSLSEISPNAHLIIACDGLWDVCSSKQAGAASNLSTENLVRKAYNAGSEDNISVMRMYLPGTKQ